MEYLPLLSNARFSAFERLGECRDGVESGGGEGGVSEEGTGGCHVVFAPLEVAAWFFGERVVLGYGFTCRPICNEGILRDGNTELLETWKKRTQHLQNILQQRHWIIIFHYHLKQSQLNDVIHANEMFRDLA